jgi:predicted lipoprotein with Yx(FWY)xxD motif
VSLPGYPRAPRTTRGAAPVKYLLAAAMLISPILLVSPDATATSPRLESASFAGYSRLLVNQSSRSLYVLSVERGARIKCSSRTCLSIWPPFLVNKSVTSISLGAGVKGKIGFVARGKTTKQVTFNSYPLYTYSGDNGAKQTHGQGIASDGGTWHLVRATATSAAATPYAHSGTATTTTTGTGGYGY